MPAIYARTFADESSHRYKPRLALRRLVITFYRMDHVYAVIDEFKRSYKGPFSILEFGVADGYAFAKKAYATRYLGMEDEHRLPRLRQLRGPARDVPIAGDLAQRRRRGLEAGPSTAAATKSSRDYLDVALSRTAGCIEACSTRR